jgi:hypothetical protein
VEHVKQNPHLRTIQSFMSFVPDSSWDIAFTGGSSCVGKCRAMQKILADRFSLKSYFIVERQDPLATPNHGAMVIPCSDGIVFLDAAPTRLFILKPEQEAILSAEPITFPPGSDGVAHTGTIQTRFALCRTGEEYGEVPPMIVKKTVETYDSGEMYRATQTEFLLRCVNNPDLSVMKRYIFAVRPYPLRARARNSDALLVVRVDFDRLRVVLETQKKDRRQSGMAVLPFYVFNQETQRIDLSLEPNLVKRQNLEKDLSRLVGPSGSLDDYWQEFRMPERVRRQVFTLASPQSASIMQSLYREAHVEDKQAQVETRIALPTHPPR